MKAKYYFKNVLVYMNTLSGAIVTLTPEGYGTSIDWEIETMTERFVHLDHDQLFNLMSGFKHWEKIDSFKVKSLYKVS